MLCINRWLIRQSKKTKGKLSQIRVNNLQKRLNISNLYGTTNREEIKTNNLIEKWARILNKQVIEKDVKGPYSLEKMQNIIHNNKNEN